jgi:CelD/BcsL family acetyltransferase involved in cellulose biosynthesis
LKTDWEHLFKANLRHSPFLAWGWVNAWLRHIAGQHVPQIACWRDAGGTLQFVLPLVLRTDGRAFGRKKFALVCSYGPDCSESLGCLYLPDIESQLAEFSAQAIAQFFDRGRRITLGYLDNTADYPSSLQRAMQANGHIVRVRKDIVCPAVSLPDTWEEFLQQRSSNFRSQIRRHYKRITEQEGLRFRSVGEAEAESFARDLIRLNRSRIQAKGEVSSLESEAFRDFLIDAIPYMASQGLAWMDVIEDDANVVGSALNLVHGKTTYYYMGGFDNRAQQLRPGTALFAQAIQRSINGGCTSYDFLRGIEPYKYRWGAEDTSTRQVDIYPHGVINGSLASAVDGLGNTLRKLIRHLRRAGKRQN